MIPDNHSLPAAHAAVDSACRALHRADEVFSTYDPGSPVSRLRRGEAALATLPPEVAEVLDLCQVAKTASRGWFDPWAMPGGDLAAVGSPADGEPWRVGVRHPWRPDALATAVAVGGDDALAAVGALDGYAGYLIREDGSEADSGGIEFVS